MLAANLRFFSDERTGCRQIYLASITLALPFLKAVVTPAAVPIISHTLFGPAVVSAVCCLSAVFRWLA